MSILWDLIQQRQIRNVTAEASTAKGVAKSAEDELAILRRRLDSLALTCEAMWELLRDSQGYNEQTLIEKIRGVDLRDGQIDGKSSRSKACMGCGRSVNTRRKSCPYCGSAFPESSGFELP